MPVLPPSPLGEVTLFKERNSHDGRDVLDAPTIPYANGRYLPAYPSIHDPYASYLPPDSASTSRFSMHSDSGKISLHPSGSLSYLKGGAEYLQGDEEGQSSSKKPVEHSRARLAFFCLVIIGVGVICGAYFGGGRNDIFPAADASPSPSASATPSNPAEAIITYGGSGAVVTTEQGSTFTYNNSFGGYFVVEQGNPFNNNARAQSWSPPLNQSWQFSKDQILGVNLGGWLVVEPFITPSLYQKYPNATDEWTLHTLMAADTASGGLNQLEDHYKTFITEEDFAQIASAGLNWVRLPIPFWAIDTWEGEPFLPKACWKYALKAFDWARKYGIRILLDIHTAPGSQNGYVHSGQSGKINFLNGVMGIANAQRHLHYIRIFTEFVSQPQYKDVIPMLGIVNEPIGMPMESLSNFYVEAYRMIRNITGVGEGHGPYITIQSGNPDLPTFNGSDRVALDQHPYFAFDRRGSEEVGPYITAACERWGPTINGSQTSFGVTVAGEFSLGFNDCGFMFHSPADEHTTTNCTQWDHWENYTATQKADLMSFAMSSMDALQHWFFWTWKIGPSATDNSPRSPLWSYKLGLDNGWIPQNPRDAYGHCASLGVAQDSPFDGTYEAYQIGTAGTDGTLDAADLAQYGQWPPTSIGLVPNATLLPTYTATGPVPTLPTQTYPAPTPPATATTIDEGDGWFNAADTGKGMVPVAGCSYPNAWDATAVAIPTAVCTGTTQAR